MRYFAASPLDIDAADAAIYCCFLALSFLDTFNSYRYREIIASFLLIVGDCQPVAAGQRIQLRKCLRATRLLTRRFTNYLRQHGRII